MADNPKKRGKADRDRVAAGQKHEVAYVAKKAGVPAAVAKKTIKAEGPMRKNVMSKLAKKKP